MTHVNLKKKEKKDSLSSHSQQSKTKRRKQKTKRRKQKKKRKGTERRDREIERQDKVEIEYSERRRPTHPRRDAAAHAHAVSP